MKAFKIYSLSHFQIYNTALLTIVIILYVTSPEPLSYNCLGLYLQPSSPSFGPIDRDWHLGEKKP